MAAPDDVPAHAPDSPLADRSLQALLLGNLFALVLAYTEGWPVATLMWVYWWQSIVIGLVNVVRVVRLRDYTTDGFKGPFGPPVPANALGKAYALASFGLFYCGFHYAYGYILEEGWSVPPSPTDDRVGIAAATVGFLVTHVFSLVWNASPERAPVRPNLMQVAMAPLVRIVPMHLTIILAGLMPGMALTLFVALKTLVDAATHWAVHRQAHRGARAIVPPAG